MFLVDLVKEFSVDSCPLQICFCDDQVIYYLTDVFSSAWGTSIKSLTDSSSSKFILVIFKLNPPNRYGKHSSCFFLLSVVLEYKNIISHYESFYFAIWDCCLDSVRKKQMLSHLCSYCVLPNVSVEYGTLSCVPFVL